MGVQIYIPADDVWSFFQSNIERLKEEMVVIAENEDTEYAVYLTEEKGFPSFAVCKGNEKPEYEEGAISESDCTETAKRCYVRYLFPVVLNNEKSFPKGFWDDDDVPPFQEEEDLTEQDRQDRIYERDDELQFALCDFLAVVLNLDCDPTEIMNEYGMDFLEDVLSYFLEYLGFEHCLDIYRPMFITDEETGCEIYTEYPYDATSESHAESQSYDLDDDDNGDGK